MRELHDLKANHTFVNKALTLVVSHEKPRPGCQDSICKISRATPNNNKFFNLEHWLSFCNTGDYMSVKQEGIKFLLVTGFSR